MNISMLSYRTARARAGDIFLTPCHRDMRAARGGSAETDAVQTRARSASDFEVVCLFAAAGLIVTALVFGLIGFDELGRVLALAG